MDGQTDERRTGDGEIEADRKEGCEEEGEGEGKDVRVRSGSNLENGMIRRLRSRFDLWLGGLLCLGMEGEFGPVEKAARVLEFYCRDPYLTVWRRTVSPDNATIRFTRSLPSSCGDLHDTRMGREVIFVSR